jgi:hypothetical protein
MSTFKAPWCRSLTLTTWIVSAVFCGAGVALSIKGVWFVAIILPATIGCFALISIRGYSITSDAVIVHRLFWDTRLELAGLQSVHFDPNAMNKSIRTGGADGLFATIGYYSNKALGEYHAFVTNPSNAVVLKYSFETVVLSPATPESFAQELTQHCSSA